LAAVRDRLWVVEQARERKEVRRVATRTIDDSWVEIRRHLDELESRAESGEPRTRARLHDRLERLREEEASAREAVRKKAEAVDEQLRELEIEVAVAENRLASELADDATSFAEAVQAELHDWDAAIERLQTRAATKGMEAREQAETEIAALRQARNRVAERLTALPEAPSTWQEQRNRVTDALDELERNVRDTAKKIY
jgi:chromosome segregation ATPase